MSDYIDTREGWKLGVTGPTSQGTEYIEHVKDGHYRRWFPDPPPVPPLPTEPYTVIRVTWRSGAGKAVLVQNGSRWDYLLGGAETVSTADLPGLISAWEPLSEPRAVTAKAVLDRVRERVSESTELARRLLAGSSSSTGTIRPADYDLRVAQTLATIAIAESLESIAVVLQNVADRGGLS